MQLKKSLKWLPFYLLLAGGTALFIMLIAAHFCFTDWDHPVVKVAHVPTVEQQVEGTIYTTKFETVVMVEGWGKTPALVRFYTLAESAWRPPWWQLLIYAGLLLFAAYVYGCAITADDFDGLDKIIGRALLICGLFYVSTTIFFIWFAHVDDVAARFAVQYDAMSALSEKIHDVYFKERGVMVGFLLPCFGILVTNVAAALLASLFYALIYEPCEEGAVRLVKKTRKHLVLRYARTHGIPTDEFLRIVGDNMEVVKTSIVVRLLPWPTYRVDNEIRAARPLHELWGKVRSATTELPTSEVAAARARILHTQLLVQRSDTETSFMNHLRSGIQKHLRAKAATLLEGALAQTRKDTCAILQDASDRTLAKFREDLIAGMLETAGEALVPFKQLVLENLRGRVIDVVHTQNGLATELLPAGTRFMLQQGDTTILVLEEEPQVRTVFWVKEDLRTHLAWLKEKGVTVTEAMKEHTKEPRFELAFPYLVYVCTFHGQKFARLRLYVRTEPLKLKTDPLGLPPLTNIYDDGSVCLGNSFKQPTGTIAEQTAAVMRYFWGSSFNLHVNERYALRNTRAHRSLEHVWRWEEASREDPRFVLNAFYEAPVKGMRTIAEMCSEDLTYNTQQTLMEYDVLVARAMEDGEVRLRAVVADFVRAVSVTRRYPKTVTDVFDGALRNITDVLVEALQAASTTMLSSNGDGDLVRTQWYESVRESLHKALCELIERDGDGKKLMFPSAEELVQIAKGWW